MSKSHDYVFAILAFGRSTELERLVDEILGFFPRANIVLLVDSYQGPDTSIAIVNKETIACGESLLREGLVVELIVPSTNLQTKSALQLLMRAAFKYSQNLIYIEDDLSLVKNPANYLAFCFEQFKNSDEIAFSTLYTSRIHSGALGELGRRTSWPESWGFVITQKNFNLLQEQITKGRKNGVGNCESRNFMTSFPLSMTTRVFLSGLKSVWLYKFDKALHSSTAWDTEYHYGLWALNMKSLSPTTNYIQDQGLHFTSISVEKKARSVHNCKSKLASVPFPNSKVMESPICSKCEVAMAHRNYMFVPRLLRKLVTTIKLG